MEPAPERPQRQSEAPRRGGAVEPLDVAEDDDRAISGREAGDLGVDGLAKLGPFGWPGLGAGRGWVEPVEPLIAPRLPGLEGDPDGDAVEPAAERLDALEPAGLAGQREEGRLEGVVGRVGVVQDPPAGAADHRPVAADEGRECRFGPGITPAPDEAAKQLGVGPLARGAVAEEPDQVLADPADSRVDHGRGPPLPWTYPSESPERSGIPKFSEIEKA
jgi:hypothetical protein